MSTLGERIKYARESKELLQDDLAKLIGVKSSGVISNWEKDLNKPNAEKIVKLCEVLEVSASYLLDYYGKSAFEAKTSEIEHMKKYRYISENSPNGATTIDIILDREYSMAEQLKENADRIAELESMLIEKTVSKRLVSYFYKNASAGTGQLIIDNLPDEDIEIPDIPKYKNVSYAIGVNGASMEPTYYDGDILLVEATREINIGEVGIFQINGECFVKKLGETELISLNHNYNNIPLDESAQTMGRVIGKL